MAKQSGCINFSDMSFSQIQYICQYIVLYKIRTKTWELY